LPVSFAVGFEIVPPLPVGYHKNLGEIGDPTEEHHAYPCRDMQAIVLRRSILGPAASSIAFANQSAAKSGQQFTARHWA
jgi:hypothetical protein